jgi:hypothetical protein
LFGKNIVYGGKEKRLARRYDENETKWIKSEEKIFSGNYWIYVKELNK